MDEDVKYSIMAEECPERGIKIRFKNNYLFNFNVLAITLLFSLIGNEVRLRKVIGQLSGVFFC